MKIVSIGVQEAFASVSRFLRSLIASHILSCIRPGHGGLAQLARAPALHAGGQRFESVILHITLKKVKDL